MDPLKSIFDRFNSGWKWEIKKTYIEGIFLCVCFPYMSDSDCDGWFLEAYTLEDNAFFELLENTITIPPFSHVYKLVKIIICRINQASKQREKDFNMENLSMWREKQLDISPVVQQKHFPVNLEWVQGWISPI